MVNRTASSTADLSSLGLSSGTLTPSFDPATLDYAATVTNDVYSVRVWAVVSHGGASVQIVQEDANGEVALSVGDNPITIIVTAQDGTTQTYTIVITRAEQVVVPPVTPTDPAPSNPAPSNPTSGSSTPSTPTVPTPGPGPDEVSTNPYKTYFIEGISLTALIQKIQSVKTNPTVSYTDVDSQSWYSDSVKIATGIGFIRGYSDNTFRPHVEITRGEFAAMLASLFDLKSDKKGSYSDISGSWAADAIEALTQVGIAKGYGDGTYRPNQTVTRAEMVAMLSRALLALDNVSKSPAFDDIEYHWAFSDIQKFAELGIVMGRTDTLFIPQADTTRAEAVTMILRMLNTTLELDLTI